MTLATAGLASTILRVTLEPRRFFRSEAEPNTSPLLVYVLSLTANGIGASGLLLLDDRDQWARAALAGGVRELILAIPRLYLMGALSHGLLRLLGGTGTFRSTIQALGYGMAPAVFGLIPFVGLLGTLWAIGVSIIGLAAVHGVRLGRAIGGYFGPVVGLVLLALGLRTFVVEAFKIPSAAMAPTLLVQDHLFVGKSSYGVLSKIAPSRGDAVVFEFPDPDPANPRQDFVKRVVGLPGDTLRVENGHLFINGWRIPSCYVGRAHLTGIEGGTTEVEIFVEFLERAQYLIALDVSRSAETDGPYEIKDGEVWVLGDNRHNSFDSRFWNRGRGGGVPIGNVKGRALLVWLPLERLGARLSGAPTLPAGTGNALHAALTECLAKAPSTEAATPPARPSR